MEKEVINHIREKYSDNADLPSPVSASAVQEPFISAYNQPIDDINIIELMKQNQSHRESQYRLIIDSTPQKHSIPALPAATTPASLSSSLRRLHITIPPRQVW